jgi:hypothetical protein
VDRDEQGHAVKNPGSQLRKEMEKPRVVQMYTHSHSENTLILPEVFQKIEAATTAQKQSIN